MGDPKIYPDGTRLTGTLGRITQESYPAWSEPPRAPEGAPNVLFFVLDDVGYGQLSSFGGLVNTPNLDRLAAHGLRYTNMHTPGLCSPSRGCILTGRNHHSLGLSSMIETATDYNGILSFAQGMLSEMMVQQGYNTFCVGKWHLIPPEYGTATGPYDRWPLGRGFERYYGFLGSDTNQWYPELIYDNHAVEQPFQPKQGYHLNIDLANKAIQFIQDAHVNAPEKPFFLYYATGAGHAPHHVPKVWADKYQGAFDMGWDEYRQSVYQRQLEMGVIPPGTRLSAHDPDVPLWDTLPDEEKRLYSRMMEVYAGFIEHTDYHFGRILTFLEEIGELDNTLIVLISDNGASSEGGLKGAVNEILFFNNVQEDFKENLKAIATLGGVDSFNHYAWGWTHAGNTPFCRWKREAFRGGVTTPCIVHWPAGIQTRGEVRSHYAHVIDLVPTVLEAIGLAAPQTIRGIPQSAIEGVSFAHTFNQPKLPSQHHTQYFEILGHRAIYHDGWRAICPWPGSSFSEVAQTECRLASPLDPQQLLEFEPHNWELYHVAEDYAETQNLADTHRNKLMEMIGHWWTEASKYQVLPIDGSVVERLHGDRPHIARHRQQFVYYPNGSPIPCSAAPKLYNCPFSITAEAVIPAGGAEGILLAQGGRSGGYTFFIKDGKLRFIYNYMGRDLFDLISNIPVPRGEVTLRYEFEPMGNANVAVGKGTSALGQLYINDILVGAMHMPHSVPIMFATAGLTCGYDGGDRVVPKEYADAFPFTGTLKRVTLAVSGEFIPDLEQAIKIAMARQ